MTEVKVKRKRRTKEEMEELRRMEKQLTADSIKSKTNLSMNESDESFFESIEFDINWLNKIADKYGFTSFQYIHKFRAFRCYKDNVHLDWVSINDLSLLFVQKRITEILLKHQELSKNRQIIELPWR